MIALNDESLDEEPTDIDEDDQLAKAGARLLTPERSFVKDK